MNNELLMWDFAGSLAWFVFGFVCLIALWTIPFLVQKKTDVPVTGLVIATTFPVLIMLVNLEWLRILICSEAMK